jgi:hypothetical protein
MHVTSCEQQKKKKKKKKKKKNATFLHCHVTSLSISWGACGHGVVQCGLTLGGDTRRMHARVWNCVFKQGAARRAFLGVFLPSSFFVAFGFNWMTRRD